MTTLPAPIARAHEGWGIVRDAQGRIYVSDIPANTVWRITPGRRAEPALRETHSHALVVGADGAIYGTNVPPAGGTRSVWRLDMSGKSTMIVPPTRGFPLDLQAFLLASDGTIYSTTPYQPAVAADQRQLLLLSRSPSGATDTVAGGLAGFADGNGKSARFSSIDGMAWLPDGSMLVVDGARLRRVTRGGKVTSITVPLTDRKWDQDLMGASVAADGSIHVADFSRRRVQHVSADGSSTATPTGLYWSPTGVLWTPEGRYFLEHPRAPFGILGDLGIGAYIRVRFVSPDGSSRVIARIRGRNTAIVVAVVLAAVMLLTVVIALLRRRPPAPVAAAPPGIPIVIPPHTERRR